MSSKEPDFVALESCFRTLQHLFVEITKLKAESQYEVKRGGHGDVHVATLDWETLLPKLVAAKTIRLRTQRKEPWRLAFRFARELKIWAELQHPHVLPLLGYYVDTGYNTAVLISEYMIHGDLKDYIELQEPSLDQRLYLVRDLTDGLAYLHGRNPPIRHGDLKTRNVLISAQKRAILADFGLSKALEEGPTGLTTSDGLKGTLRYYSPELICDTDACQSLSSEVWAWACLVLEVLAEKIPYAEKKSEHSIIAALMNNDPPIDVQTLALSSPVVRDLLASCWTIQPQERPSARLCLDVIEAELSALQHQQPPPVHHQHEQVDRSYDGSSKLGGQRNGVAQPLCISKPPPVEGATSILWRSGKGSANATVKSPAERKRRGGAKEKDGAGTSKPLNEKKERERPPKGAARIEQRLIEQGSDRRGSVALTRGPGRLHPAPPFKEPSGHKISSPQREIHRHSSTTTPFDTQPPAHFHLWGLSVHEDYDAEETELEDGHWGAVDVPMPWVVGDDHPAPPPPTEYESKGCPDSPLYGGLSGIPSHSPTFSNSGPIDRGRFPPVGGSNAPLKRRAKSSEIMEGESKRFRIDINEQSPAASSPPVPSKLNSILSPTEPSSCGPPFNTQPRRASLGPSSDTQSRRSWVGVDHQRKASSTSPSQNKPRSSPSSPQALPPITTLTDSPSSPSASKDPAHSEFLCKSMFLSPSAKALDIFSTSQPFPP